MHLRKGRFSGRIGVTILAVAMTFGPALSLASPAVSLAEIRGNVLGADGIEAVPGVVVKAAHLETQTVFSSTATSADGSYRLADLPSGTYDLAVETTAGLFLSDQSIRVGAGNAAMVSFALQPMLAPEGDEPEEGDTGDDPAEEEQPEGEDDQADSDDAEEPEPDQQQKKKKGTNFFKTPVGAATTLVVSGVLLSAAANSATDDDIDLDTGSMTPSN